MAAGGDQEKGEGKSQLPYPKAAYFILGGYLLERFVYYGLFGGSVFYMQRVLGFTASGASTAKSILESLIYFAPILGAILSDTYLGKVRTVMIMCCAYVVGAAIFSLSSVTPIMTSMGLTQTVGIGGILFLGLSAGLMKAVYSSLGPDQFKMPEQREQQKRFFYAFYWMVNAGAFCGQLLTAQLRQSVQCFGDDCYFLPYIILCGIMVLSFCIFAAGRSRYIEAPPDNTFIRVMKCIFCAIRKKRFFGIDEEYVNHWVDRSAKKFDAELIKEVKVTLRVVLLFTTYPLFWALFFQSSTGMVFQAKRLYDYIGDYRVPPELTSSINPLLVLALIPIFDLVVYPLCAKFNVFQETTTRMTAGMMFCVASFLIYSVVSTQTEQTFIGHMESRLHVYNSRNECVASVTPTWSNTEATIPSNQQLIFDIPLKNTEEARHVKISCGQGAEEKIRVVLESERESTLIITDKGSYALLPTIHYIKDIDAESKIRIISPWQYLNETITLKYNQFKKEAPLLSGVAAFQTISPQKYEIVTSDDRVLGASDIRQDGVYDIVIVEDKVYTFPVTKPSDVHIFAMFPQYVVLTTGEVLFSVSALDFAYAEAPASMKSIIMATNLFTITVGLWFYAALNSINSATGVFLHRTSWEAVTYAVLMAIDIVVFIFLIKRFNKSRNKEDSEFDLKEKNVLTSKPENDIQDGGIDNPAYQ